MFLLCGTGNVCVVSVCLYSKIQLDVERVVVVAVGVGRVHDSSLLVLCDSSLEEVGLSLHGDHVHPLERVGVVVELAVPEADEESICDESHIL